MRKMCNSNPGRVERSPTACARENAFIMATKATKNNKCLYSDCIMVCQVEAATGK